MYSELDRKEKKNESKIFFFFFLGGGESGERARETKEIYKELCREQASEIKREGKV